MNEQEQERWETAAGVGRQVTTVRFHGSAVSIGKQEFTLIELLVVIAILATLWAADHNNRLPSVAPLDRFRWNCDVGDMDENFGRSPALFFAHDGYFTGFRLLICPRQGDTAYPRNEGAGRTYYAHDEYVSGHAPGLFNYAWVDSNGGNLSKAWDTGIATYTGAWYDRPAGARFLGVIGTNFRSRRPHWYAPSGSMADSIHPWGESAYVNIKTPSTALRDYTLTFTDDQQFPVDYMKWVDANWPYRFEDSAWTSHVPPSSVMLSSCHLGNYDNGDGLLSWHAPNSYRYWNPGASVYPAAFFDGRAKMSYYRGTEQKSGYFLPNWDNNCATWNR